MILDIRSSIRAAAALFALSVSSSCVLAQAVGEASGPPAAAAGSSPAAPVPAVALPLFATVNGRPITQAEFHSAFATYMRQTFYHGQVPEGGMERARKEVTEQIVTKTLQIDEIERRGVRPDAESIEKQIADYERNYAGSANWQKNRVAMLPGLRALLGQQNQLARLEAEVRDVPAPTPDEVKDFYARKPELFTEPRKLRVRAIVLAVDPSGARPIWDAAISEAQKVVRRIRGGDDFAEQARLVSSDENAANGGDMGYLHVGMLPDGLQDQIDKLKVGEVSEPMETLQGVAIFRVEERVEAKLQPFERVAERAAQLLLRERKDQAWQGFLAKLRSSATIVFHEPAAAATATK